MKSERKKQVFRVSMVCVWNNRVNGVELSRFGPTYFFYLRENSQLQIDVNSEVINDN